jgi:hypothetical protein
MEWKGKERGKERKKERKTVINNNLIYINVSI